MNLRANKKFGQNFLIDKDIIEKIIVSFAPVKDENILEIGPGLGALTKHLNQISNNFNSLEIDSRMVSYLTEKKLPVIQADILNFDLNSLNQDISIIGNLPYNISSQIIFKLIDHIERIKKATLMVQLEMAQRITAKPNDKNYGRISVICSYFFDSNIEFIVPKEAFNPVPKVTSAIINLKPTKKRKAVDISKLSSIVKTAFQMRRKTLSNSLCDYKSIMQKANIDSSLRAENLSLDDYINISNGVS